jgi:hypothetical protein
VIVCAKGSRSESWGIKVEKGPKEYIGEAIGLGSYTEMKEELQPYEGKRIRVTVSGICESWTVGCCASIFHCCTPRPAIVAVALVIFPSGCVEQPAPPTTIAPTTTADTAILHATVIDKTTGEPIENVIVYLGSMGGSGKCYTDGGGKCSIEGVSWGSYAVNVFKKGYNRPAIKRGNIGKEEKNISVELKLEKKSEIPTSFTVEGTVIEIITAEGTRSENHYYKIRDDDGNEEYIFNKIGVNQGFEEFVNKRVRITGFREIGFIGWQHEKVEGIYVEEIEVI